MQYSVLVAVAVIVVSIMSYRAYRYIRHARNYFVGIDDNILKKHFDESGGNFSYNEFKRCWIAASTNLNCPKGKVVKNCRIGELQLRYPFPEMFIDDLCDGFEEQVKSALNLDMLFSDLIIYFLSGAVSQEQTKQTDSHKLKTD